MMKLAAIFPGQGAQSVGMLADIAEAHTSVKEKFDVASQVLGFDLWSMVQEGPNEVLGSTENTQPALLVASVALWELWSAGAEKVNVMAGHSLGEYSALVCAGAISFADGVKLVRTRGELMQRAVPNGQGGMAAILGLDDEAIEACCAAVAGEVSAANYNAPGQVVIAGAMSAVDEAIEACKAAGAKRALKLDVSGPFHSKLMAAAAADFSQALDAIDVVMPRIPVVQNVHARVAKDVSELKSNLVEQLYSPVQWTASVESMLGQGLQQCVECGPGNVLAGLVKRISRETPTIGLSKIAGLEAANAL
ncbi:MAG: [acyl-carrier-protein] S-malonyltransferase [Candidatus Azotimanducaceae bacterium]|jgi:[acyl-carrier-protein] S-malonyltransferase|tara:strand:+ start:2321 stop:3241 length:921 start_codon:yes stop_codon:yes gene_type:complete